MVVSSGFSGHVIVSERSEAFLRSNGLITTAQLPINTLNHQQVHLFNFCRDQLIFYNYLSCICFLFLFFILPIEPAATTATPAINYATIN